MEFDEKLYVKWSTRLEGLDLFAFSFTKIYDIAVFHVPAFSK